MRRENIMSTGKVGNRPGKFDHTRAGSGGKSHPLDYAFQQDLAFIA